MVEKKGLVFFDTEHMDLILKEIGWNEEKLKEEKCVVCGCHLSKDNIGGFTKESPIKGVCRKFPCVMTVLLKTKKESLT